ncbi:HIT family protein [Arthrobacter sp. MYb227]|uniref:HIT family protein n=1 Tax=Arthrobacter sp. MYb227 TaxID=1848601 RepID=UPI001C613199|nr:HIT domain-containing protein [Arthrobacter sp. MYb227]
MDEDCIFCQIIAGRVTGFVIAANKLCVAFLDARPLNPGHTLVVPRAHHRDLHSMDEQTSAAMFNLAQQVANKLKSSELPCDGISLEMSNGAAAEQSIFHAHLHVVPRLIGDGLGRVEPPIARPGHGALAATARLLSA